MIRLLSHRRRHLLIGLALSLALGGCVSAGEPLGLSSGVMGGEPPRNDGTIPDSFKDFVEEFRKTAEARGISSSTYDAAFAGIGPDMEVLEKARNQAEFVKPVWEYLDDAASNQRVNTGRAYLSTYAGLLDQIEGRYGVDRQVVLAIWGMESTFGEVLNNPKVVRNAVRALATLAWGGGKRAGYGRTQLLAVLKILQKGDVDSRHITGSWAGAMGHTQFIPTTYLGYAVDFDGDGKRNIWTSIPDALASTANYLAKSGWRKGDAWGYEVVIPVGAEIPGGTRKSLAAWAEAGLTRLGGRALPDSAAAATMFYPAKGGGPALLIMHNFNVIKRYNNANAYALGVGHLGDRIVGGGPFEAKWPRAYEPLTDDEKLELQTRLKSLGFDIGEIDGKIGSGTIAAIKAFQEAKGVAVDGAPSPAFLALLRANS
jgi:membrane-bound lytic murein transglycosylase B